jgi:hypothetical protein
MARFNRAALLNRSGQFVQKFKDLFSTAQPRVEDNLAGYNLAQDGSVAGF